MERVTEVRNEEFGMKATVDFDPERQQYIVKLIDMDSGLELPTFHKFTDEHEAITDAIFIIGGQNNESN